MNVLRVVAVGCLLVGLVGCGGSPTSRGGGAPKASDRGKGPETKEPEAKGPETKEPEAKGPEAKGPEAKEPTTQEKLLGKWEVTKTASGAPPGATVEFLKDGKMRMTAKAGGKEMTMESTYILDGDKLTNTQKGPGGKEVKETITIVKLTDKELVTKDEKGRVDEFKKK